jgi:hypothetical protein
MGMPRGLSGQPHLDRDAMGGEPRMAPPRDLRIGILDGETTRAMPAAMIASTQGGVFPVMGALATASRKAWRRGPVRRRGATSRPPAWGRPPGWGRGLTAATGADCGIGPGIAESAPAEHQREVREALIVMGKDAGHPVWVSIL